ncbi:MAG: hypothetical protein AAB877_03600 [Patescibacteria group bacterium]
MKNQKGQISRTLIIIAIVWLVLIVVIFFIINATVSRKKAPAENPAENNEPPAPVYEKTLGDIRFIFQSAVDMGGYLKGSYSYDDLKTTERFIKVTVAAQNKGKTNIPQFIWDIGNIVDSEGRNFVSINERAYNFVPRPDLCGALLKPEFDPIPCVKFYEVSKISSGLKVQITTEDQNNKKQKDFIDLFVTR